jgi:hypothetical protein
MEGLIFGRMSKPVPTDMHWYPNYPGDYVKVTIYKYYESEETNVSICGADDCMVGRIYDTWEEALVVFNSITYIQSAKDLVPFTTGNLSTSNGWPGERMVWDDKDVMGARHPPREEWEQTSRYPYPWGR